MASITLYERETIINYNDAEELADIYTHDKALQRHIEKKLGIKPYYKEGLARTYKLPKKWLRYPQKPSEKRREAARKSLQERGGRISRKDKVSAGAQIPLEGVFS